jgi:hypothetical protein
MGGLLLIKSGCVHKIDDSWQVKPVRTDYCDQARKSNAERRPHHQHRLHRLKSIGPTACVWCDKSCAGCLDNAMGWRGKLPLTFFPRCALDKRSDGMADSLARHMELPLIPSHLAQFQQICRNHYSWRLTGLQPRFRFLCMNRRGQRIALGQLRI